jgi:hypothetical protein
MNTYQASTKGRAFPMANATVAQPINFTREDLQVAVSAALAKVTDARWVRAIYRAAGNPAAGQFSYDGNQVILHSATSTKVYHIDTREPMRCSCQAHTKGLLCWHITAARLIVRAAEHHAAAPAPQPRIAPNFIDLQAAADELFA